MTALVRPSWRLRPIATPAVVGGGTLLAALGLWASLSNESMGLLLLTGGILALVGAAYVACWISPAALASGALAATLISGNASRVGIPVGPDRVLVLAAVGSIVAGLPGAVRTRVIVWRPIHAALALLAVYATVSALEAGTLRTSDGLFGLLDRLGIVPFLMFTIAPLVFGSERARNVLLTTLVGAGLYLGFTALAEALGLRGLIFPRYINDPSVGLHFGRARGPFVESVANGLALYGCAVASALAVYLWRERPQARVVAALSCGLCLAGTIFTLTRAVWLATVVATLVAFLLHARTRALLGPLVAAGFVVLLAGFVLIPGFAAQVDQRQSDQRPIWDRYNTNAAAVRAIEDEPLFGVGFKNWINVNDRYLRVAPDYPLTGTEIEIHNVPLTLGAELGLVGLALWASAYVAGIGGAIFRPGPSDLDPWRLAMVALAMHWTIVAGFGPLGYAFPNLLLWTWAGICSIGHLSRAPEPVGARPAAAHA
jgi:putative inorganic carbon (hco3(-)) transporter